MGADTLPVMPPITAVVLMLCDACLDGEGGECHHPSCAMWMNRAPDLPLRDKVVCEVDFKMADGPDA